MSGELPKNIKSILTDDETIEEVFNLKDCEVYATNKRLIERHKRKISDYAYNHVSSITYESKRYYWLVLIGVLVIVVGIWFRDLTNDMLSWVVIIIGLAFAIGAIFIKTEWVEINVVGLRDPIYYRGDREELDSLLYLVRQNRISASASGQKENAEISAIAIIKQFAELRDKGILTQEEFEEKKRGVLRDFS
ncbi:SHOCT domain-containing protein [Chloroflexota bacterium]